MPVKYVLVERKNPQAPEAPKKWYAQPKSTREVSLKQLGKEITQRSTVNYADTLAVLEALTQMLLEHLENGDLLKLNDFGSFAVSFGSEGAETEEKFHPSMINHPKVLFRAGMDLKKMLLTLDYEKTQRTPKKAKPETPDE